MSNKRKNGGTEDSTISSKLKKTHWSLGLIESLNDKDCIVESDELLTVIKDKFPKAKFHYLVIPKENISSLKSITEKHLGLLQHMHNIGKKLTRQEGCKAHSFKLGYHSEPSMARLHLHVISDDMNSPSLKTKKHWNSFTTNFFLDSESLCEELKLKGKIILPSKEQCRSFIELDLKCHKCSVKPKNMPDLKKHILTHLGDT